MRPLRRPVERYTILPGRFQPPHNDHVALVRQLAATVSDPLYLGLITHAPLLVAGPEPDMPEMEHFDAEARRQNQPERTPFTFAQRAAMWRSIFVTEMDDLPAPQVIALPRPESAWPWIEAVFPGLRTWVVPDCGEPFDDMKARFFAARGDRVIRPRLPATTDGQVVRSVLGDPGRLAENVPICVATWVTAWITTGAQVISEIRPGRRSTTPERPRPPVELELAPLHHIELEEETPCPLAS